MQITTNNSSFNKIAYFFSPQQGHLIPYARFFERLQEIYGLDVYVSKEFAYHFAYKTSNKVIIKGFDNFKMGPGFMKVCFQAASASFEEIDELWKQKNYKPQLIILDIFGIVGKILAKKYNIPYLTLDSNFFYDSEQALQFLLRDGFNEQWQKEMIQLVDEFENKFQISFEKLESLKVPILNRLCSSQHEISIVPPVFTINGLPRSMKMLGPIFDRKQSQSDLDEIKNINKKGKSKLIYIAFGTIYNKNTQIIQLVLDSIKDLVNVFALTSINSEVEKQIQIPDNVFNKNFWDSQLAILQQVDLFISHCGMGSFMEALCSAVPIIGFPQGSEQFVIAKQVKELQIGDYFEQLPENKEQVTQVINQVLNNNQYKINAQKLSSQINNDSNLALYLQEVENIIKSQDLYSKTQQQQQ